MEMNRRGLVAGGMAALAMGKASAQEASPVADDSDAVVLLRDFLERVIGEGDARAVSDFFDEDAWDIDALYWEFTDIQSDARRRKEEFVFDLRLIYGDDRAALAFGVFGAGSWTDKDFFIAINADDGKITRYRWMAEMS